jgi:hypothetical protein
MHPRGTGAALGRPSIQGAIMFNRLLLVLSICVGAAAVADAQPIIRRLPPNRPAAPGSVNLPYQVADSDGSTWAIYNGGWIQQRGNRQIYSQGAMININGAPLSSRSNQGRLDPKTGELVLDDLQAGSVELTRRILIDPQANQVRYVDVLTNTEARKQDLTVVISSNINYGITTSQPIDDPRKKEQQIAWVGQTGAGQCALEIYAGKGAHDVPTIDHKSGNRVQASYSITLPPNGQAAIVHLHSIVDTVDAGQQAVSSMSNAKILNAIPADLRKLIVNFPNANGFVDNREILRGDVLDVVEIRGGDQMRGTLKPASYKLDTFYGPIELPADRVIAMLNVGEFRPRQLLVTPDGEVFGGKLQGDSIPLELSSGQIINIPLRQITRLGYRKRAGEPDQWSFDKPYVLLQSGDRICVQMPTQPIDVLTRYGTLKLDPKNIATLAFSSDDQPVHEIYLTDGSRFAGLVQASQFAMTLAGGANGPSTAPSPQAMTFPASAVTKIQLAGPPPDVDASAPQMQLLNDDLLVGALEGEMKLDTAFDTITINAGEIKKLVRPDQAPLDVQVTLWDSSILSGQLEDPTLHCRTSGGIAFSIPIALVQQYDQPQPQPGAATLKTIKSLVADLNADDWKQRDRAQGQLTQLGSVVVGTLKQMRATQPPEAQQRIDQILAAMAGNKEK